jgi:purine-nucleoside phosphorylase
MITRINEAVDYIRKIYPDAPSIGVVLGSGLGSFTAGMKVAAEIHYADIPHFPPEYC